jgi:hypothetical protein
VGLEPVGVVTASVPTWPFKYQYPAWMRSAMRHRPVAASKDSVTYSAGAPPDDVFTAKRGGGFTRDYAGGGASAVLFPDTGFSWQRMVQEVRQRQLFAATITCLTAETRELGGHGIVAVEFSWRHRPDLDYGGIRVQEVTAVGLAVRARNADYKQVPFTATLSATEVCAALRSGLAPSQIVIGIGVVTAVMGNSTRRIIGSNGLVEVDQFSEAVQMSLSIATKDIQRAAAANGDLIVGSKPTVVFERHVGAGIESRVRIVGTAVRRFRPPEQSDILPILRL